MACCSPYVEHFSNVSSTTINYGASLQAAHGPAPKVTVLYWDGTQYVAAGIVTQVRFDTYPVTQIVIDHGSVDGATGLVKLG
jgi:hypothetical protein